LCECKHLVSSQRTRHYLELTNRQAKIERDIIDVSHELAAGVKPTLPI
jgi:hypothetical protein